MLENYTRKWVTVLEESESIKACHEKREVTKEGNEMVFEKEKFSSLRHDFNDSKLRSYFHPFSIPSLS